MTRLEGFPARPDGGTFVIAEAGVNHNGDPELAKKLIEAARDSGADAVKFQTWKPGEITGRFAMKAGYQEHTTAAAESRYELSNRLALAYPVFAELKDHAEKCGILFLSTPDGFDSLAFLVDDLKLPIVKVGSTEITHPQFLEAVGRTGLPVILSTGLSTLDEVEKAVAALRRGGEGPLVLLHCTSEYPAPVDEINLRAMTTLHDAFGFPVGLSDHSEGAEAAIAAVALGAVIIEKHFTLDRSLGGPDHAASMEPGELKALVDSIRRTGRLLGDGIKQPTPSERANMDSIRRGVVARVPIARGTRLSAALLACKRPGGGIAPEHLDRLIGMRAAKDFDEDEPLQWEHLD